MLTWVKELPNNSRGLARHNNIMITYWVVGSSGRPRAGAIVPHALRVRVLLLTFRVVLALACEGPFESS